MKCSLITTATTLDFTLKPTQKTNDVVICFTGCKAKKLPFAFSFEEGSVVIDHNSLIGLVIKNPPTS